MAKPVRVEDGSIRFKPSAMVLGRFYVVDLNGRPYVYRLISESEVEIYGTAS